MCVCIYVFIYESKIILNLFFKFSPKDMFIDFRAGVSNLWSMGCLRLRTAVNAAEHKIINLLKTL